MTAMSDMSDKELDTLLHHAKQPALPAGFAERLQARLDVETPQNVVAFPQRPANAAASRVWWLSALPLAASLVFGLYVGAMDSLPESLTNLTLGGMADVSDLLMDTGTEDTESFLNGELS
jgi:anti-sigma factor RsiW